jgi:hypothetical protein
MRKFIIALTAFGMITTSVSASAETCRDAKGKFTKCPSAAPAKSTHCRDSKGKFVKCGTKSAKPA